MVIDINTCLELIRDNDEFIVLSHEHPDGDTLGSAFALCEMLRVMGKKRRFMCNDEIPDEFYYLTKGFQQDEVENPLIVAVDVADEKLLGGLAKEFSGKIDLCIDHHLSNTMYAKNTFVEDRSAAAEIIYEIILLGGIDADRYMRNCIYTGISTDTGCFRYQNTAASTFRIAADLMEKGVDSQLINKLMFETKTKSFLQLELLVRKTLEYHFDGSCALLTITQDMYRQSGSNEHECHSLTALPRQIEGVKVGAVIKEKADGTYGVSVRTEADIDASEICKRLGGGGHKGAAGSSFDCSYEEDKKMLLESIGASLKG